MITIRNISTKLALLALCLGTLGFSSLASAQENNGPFFGKNAPGKWIIGVKAANIDPNFDAANDADGFGIVLGYEFARSIGDAGGSSTFELEYISGDEEGIGNLFEYEANILNAFFTYRSAGTLYFKVKGGLSYADIEVNSLIAPQSTFEDVSLAAGIGLGVRIKDYGVVELEYSQDSGESDLSVLGVNALLEF